MRSLLALAAAAGLIACGSAEAGVTGVVTSSTATMTFKPDLSGTNVVFNYSGDQISGNVGDNAFGSGGNFASTSEVEPGLVSFKNGNASAGEYAYVTSQTDVDITFANDGETPVIPRLKSEIVPAGLGVYASALCLNALTSCPESQAVNFQTFEPDSTDYRLAGASVDFKILSGGVTLYDLTASVDLVQDPTTNRNYFVDDIAQAQATLNGFGLETEPGSQTRHGFNWQATDIDVDFPSDSVLLPGQSDTLTYQTTVSTYSQAPCSGYSHAFAAGCLIAYSSFGDPIGGSTGIKPGVSLFGLTPGALEDDRIANLSYGTFAFGFPTFENGVLTYILAPVPEPSAWMLALFGGGLIGVALRRQGKRPRNEGATLTPG